MDFAEGVTEIAKHDDRYSKEAYFFVSESLSFTQKMLDRKGHVTGRELLEGVKRYALDEFGYMARVVLESWGVKRTEDVGEIVFSMVNHSLLGKMETDIPEDFEGGYDFKKVFEEGFKF
jgi:uncharacterized repeat protein (TIGR04138 family)